MKISILLNLKKFAAITFSLAVALVWSVPASAITQSACTSFGGTTNFGNCYIVDFTYDTWIGHEANAQSISSDMHLASIHSQAENNYIASLITAHQHMWIGLNDVASEGDYVWVDGTPFDFVNWASGEPNNSNNEDYVHMVTPTDASSSRRERWNDLPNSFHNSGIYMAPITNAQVSEPAALPVMFGFVAGLIALRWKHRA